MSKFLSMSDKTAIGLSMLCVVHCIATPIVLLALPSISGLLAFDHEIFHTWLLFAVIPISLFAIILGYFHHRRVSVFVISALGMLALIAAAVLGHSMLGEFGEVGLTLLGSVLITLAHLRNLNFRMALKHLSGNSKNTANNSKAFIG
ncbi:MAG: MerC domain-containing protein [Glaciecola sp.]